MYLTYFITIIIDMRTPKKKRNSLTSHSDSNKVPIDDRKTVDSSDLCTSLCATFWAPLATELPKWADSCRSAINRWNSVSIRWTTTGTEVRLSHFCRWPCHLCTEILGNVYVADLGFWGYYWCLSGFVLFGHTRGLGVWERDAQMWFYGSEYLFMEFSIRYTCLPRVCFWQSCCC